MREISFVKGFSFKKEYAYEVIRLDVEENKIYFFDSKGKLKIRVLNTNFKDSFKEGDLVYQWVSLGVTNYQLVLKFVEDKKENLINGLSVYNQVSSIYRGIHCYGTESKIKYRFRQGKGSLSSIVRENLHMGSQERIIAGRCRFNNLIELEENLDFEEYLVRVSKAITVYVAENISPRIMFGIECPYLISDIPHFVREKDLISDESVLVVNLKIPKTCTTEEISSYKKTICELVVKSVEATKGYFGIVKIDKMYRVQENQLRVVLKEFTQGGMHKEELF